MQRIIFHIDMNSYFATCEQQANPLLRGKPIGICEHLGGIIIAPSIEAKRYGVKTATPVWEAKKMCPKIILMPTDPEKYRTITKIFLDILTEYTEALEKYSIDEAFLDMSAYLQNAPDPWVRAEEVAREIKEKVYKRAGVWLKCSVGVGESKLIAKIASDLQKPDGLTVIRPEEKDLLYDRLALTDIPGIARRTERNLNALGIRTLKDLRDYPQSKLVAHFGIAGYHLSQMGQLRGSWHEELGENLDEPIKSMGHAYTLPHIVADRSIALQILYKLSEMVGRRLRESNLMGNVISCVVADRQGGYYGKSKKLSNFLYDGRDIFLEAAEIVEQTMEPTERFKYVGVTVAGLKPFVEQRSLFDADRKEKELVKFLDRINDKYGDFTISRLPAWQARGYIRDSVGFGRMKEFKVRYKNKG